MFHLLGRRAETYRERGGGGRPPRGQAFLPGGTILLCLTWWNVGATTNLALSHNGLELLQLLIFHQELVLHLHLHDINTSVLEVEGQRRLSIQLM